MNFLSMQTMSFGWLVKAGVYIPTLANQILQQNGPISSIFQGFMIGMFLCSFCLRID